ncbi:antitoxin Xre/MbcA/ParS toxin-binding domain-containing protein [Cellvibrio sp.]|uniref:antitoxin Xre/MbcA/ParS toxin-binding domain-containing protein n=1 Tax=Cellvibrio sp. TaxID=1965322 RepID=UPI0039647D90
MPTHIFPEQQNLAYQWISQQNKAFNGTPAAFVALNGLSGLVEIRNYLSNVCGANSFDFAVLT